MPTVNLPRTSASSVSLTLPRNSTTREVAAAPSDARDTTGGVVPVWKAHAFTYDTSGNLATDTVTDGANTWVRTYGWSGGAQTSDSGWVKQNG